MFSAAFFLSAGSLRAERQTVDRIVAVIENEILTLRELEKKAQPFMDQLDEITDQEERQTRRKEILRSTLRLEVQERLIDKEVKANSDKLSVSEQDVDRAVEEVLKMNRLNRKQLQAALYGQGTSWSEYRKQLRKQIARSRLIQFQVQGKLEVKEEDVRNRCLEKKRAGRIDANQQVCASHILLSVQEDADAAEVQAMREKALALRAQILNGADFAQLAQENSGDAGSPNGELGCFGQGEMLEAFEEAAFQMDPGEISAPVRTELGFHLIRLDSRGVGDSGCNDPSELAAFQNEIYQEQMEQKMRSWVEELRAKAFVEERL